MIIRTANPMPIKVLMVHLGTVPTSITNVGDARFMHKQGLIDGLLWKVGGGSRRFLEVCKRLSEKHEVSVMVQSEFAETIRVCKINVKNIYTIHVPFEKFLGKTPVGMALVYLLRVLQASTYNIPRDFDIIYSTDHQLHDILPAVLLSRRISRCKVVTYVHHLIPTPFTRGLDHPLLASILSWASQLLSFMLMKHFVHLTLNLGWSWVDELSRKGVPIEKMKILNEAIDVEYINKIPRAKEENDAYFIGRIDPVKGIFDLIEIWSKVSNELPEAKLAIIGSGPPSFICRLLNRIERTSLQQNVKYIGPLSESEKFSLLKSGKVFTFPSREEGWGIAVCEAMACGLPAIVYDLPAYKKVYSQGIVTVPLGDIEKFAKVTVKLLTNDNLRRKLSNEARIQARKYDWDSTISRELQILRNVKRR